MRLNPSTPAPDDIERDERINVAVSEYETAIDRGEAPEPAEWVARHPELAPELASYFQGLETLGFNPPTASESQRELEVTHDLQADSKQSASVMLPLERLGDYILLERLGRGGEGTVYRARHRVNDHEVALKMVTAASGADLRIRDEARAIATLRHPYIVRIHFSGEDQGIWYYTMELMDGGGLDERLGQFKKNPREAAELLQKISQGIHHAHTRGILHLDLKPANVLLDGDGLPHVSDFGLALRIRAREEIAKPDTSEFDSSEFSKDLGPGVLNLTKPQIRGTAPYMSPEMAAGRLSAVSTSADIYGLGAILYTMLTGKPPIVGTSMGDTLFRVVHERPIPPRSINKSVDRELQAICLKCLRKDPARRYGSADALNNDIGRWLRREPTLAGEPNARKRAWFWFKRHPWGTSLGVLSVLLFWMVGVVGSLGELREGNRREAAQLAHEASIQLKMVERAVSILAKEPEFRQTLKEWPDGSPQQLKRLDEVLHRANTECNSWFDITGGNPLVNMFILNNDGVMLADTFAHSTSVGLTFSLRDYYHHFHGHKKATLKRDAVYVSRSFRSVKDSLYKIALSTRIWDGGKPLGLIVANVTIGPSLLLLNMAEENPGMLIAAPVDWTYSYRGKGTPAASERAPYLAALHRDYLDPKHPPIWLPIDGFPRLPDFEKDEALAEAVELDRAGSVIHYRRVGSTPLVVVARHLYPWPVRPFLDAKRRPWAILGVIAIVMAPSAFLIRRRVKSRPASPPLSASSSLPATV